MDRYTKEQTHGSGTMDKNGRIVMAQWTDIKVMENTTHLWHNDE